MEDPIELERKALTWPEEKLRKAQAQELYDLVHDYNSFVLERGKHERLTRGLTPEFCQKISIEWGKWSHEFNKVIRARIKEHDLFQDNAEQRFAAKKLNLVFLIWWKFNSILEMTNTPILTIDYNSFLKATEELKEAEYNFINLKIEEMPEWVKSLQAEKKVDQE